jgi:2-keto-3-deoxy-galactonokinase
MPNEKQLKTLNILHKCHIRTIFQAKKQHTHQNTLTKKHVKTMFFSSKIDLNHICTVVSLNGWNNISYIHIPAAYTSITIYSYKISRKSSLRKESLK